MSLQVIKNATLCKSDQATSPSVKSECSQGYLIISLAYCCFTITIEISFHTPVQPMQWFIPIQTYNSYFHQQISLLIYSTPKELFCNLPTFTVALVLLLTKWWDPLKSISCWLINFLFKSAPFLLFVDFIFWVPKPNDYTWLLVCRLTLVTPDWLILCHPWVTVL